MIKETLQLIPQKYNGSWETRMNNYIPNKLDNLEKLGKFLETYNLKWNVSHSVMSEFLWPCGL